jgi:hypothetical protein
MKKVSPFHEAKPRTARGEAREREITAMQTMADLLDLDEEEAFKQNLAEKYGIVSGNPRYERIMATWRELRRGRP